MNKIICYFIFSLFAITRLNAQETNITPTQFDTVKVINTLMVKGSFEFLNR